MKNIEKLVADLKEKRHPGARIIEKAIEVSNDSYFIAGVAAMLLAAAQLDMEEERRAGQILGASLKSNN